MMERMQDGGSFAASDYVTLFVELLERSSDAVLLARASDGAILEANEAFLSLFQVSRSDVIGRRITDLDLSAQPSGWGPAWAHAEAGRSDLVRLRLRSRWSEEFWFELSVVKVPFRGEDAVLGIGHPERTSQISVGSR
jgi:PAS domain-containing protein